MPASPTPRRPSPGSSNHSSHELPGSHESPVGGRVSRYGRRASLNSPLTAPAMATKEKMRERYKRNRALGLCGQCSAPSAATYCQPCGDYIRERNRARLLVPFRNCRCGKQSAAFYRGDFRCRDCLAALRAKSRAETKEKLREYYSDYSAAKIVERRTLGVCTHCGKRPPAGGLAWCGFCISRNPKWR